MEYGAIFLIGFLGSFGHCIGMCGGFAAAFSMNRPPFQDDGKSGSLLLRNIPQLLYNGGRISTYVILGCLASLLASGAGWFTQFYQFQAALLIFAGLVMVVVALQTTGWISAKHLPAVSHRIWRGLKPLIRGGRLHHYWGIGMLLGLIPCGLLYAALAAAAVSGNPLTGATLMLVFGLGTVPGLLIVGVGAGAVSVQRRQRLLQVAALLVIGMGLLTMGRGITGFMSPTGFANEPASSSHCEPGITSHDMKHDGN